MLREVLLSLVKLMFSDQAELVGVQASCLTHLVEAVLFNVQECRQVNLLVRTARIHGVTMQSQARWRGACNTGGNLAWGLSWLSLQEERVSHNSRGHDHGGDGAAEDSHTCVAKRGQRKGEQGSMATVTNMVSLLRLMSP